MECEESSGSINRAYYSVGADRSNFPDTVTAPEGLEGHPVRTFSIISTLVVLLTSCLLVSTAVAQWPQTTSHNPWSLEIGGKAYDRPGDGNGFPLIIDSNTRVPLFDSDDATDLGGAAGAEVKFNFQSSVGQEWEIRSILANWDEASDQIVGPNIESQFFPTDVVPNTFDYESSSDFFSIEIMARKAVVPGAVLMFGPRIVSSKDHVSLISQFQVDPNDGTPLVTINARSDFEATNILLGLQGGLEFNKPVSEGFYINGFIRTGGYFNPTEVTFTDVDTVTPLVRNQLTKSTGSFLGEVGGRAYVDIVPNCASCYVGYEATWIDGIAVAPAQILTTTIPPAIDTSNTIFFQAVTFGLKFTR